MPPRDLILRTRLFALAVRNFCKALPFTDESREAAGQLRRAANSVRSNYRASKKARSRAEFETKLGTTSEEADEAVNWLEYLGDTGIKHDPGLLQVAQALARIFAAAVKTARRNTEELKRHAKRRPTDDSSPT